MEEQKTHLHLLQERKGCGKRLPVPGTSGAGRKQTFQGRMDTSAGRGDRICTEDMGILGSRYLLGKL